MLKEVVSLEICHDTGTMYTCHSFNELFTNITDDRQHSMTF